ncbi:hypothetical protein [Paenibacillus sp. S150]|uniref:hypothetical protein n=1 Tax=Paenibacillus sp. S150 TaxID=2749826 RepID=UPI001C577D69|nr:hypothetical protein [Paenibacillus sp. S150]MBW4083549.1 hypothetical protein [Paenibacillus sp. S150]
MRLGADLKKEIQSATVKPKEIKMSPYTFEDIRQDKGCQGDIMEWFPNGGFSFMMIPIKVDLMVKKWEFVS